MLKLLDVLVQLDHLKNAKASIPNDFSWYKRYGNNLWSILFCYILVTSPRLLEVGLLTISSVCSFDH